MPGFSKTIAFYTALDLLVNASSDANLVMISVCIPNESYYFPESFIISRCNDGSCRIEFYAEGAITPYDFDIIDPHNFTLLLPLRSYHEIKFVCDNKTISW